MSKEKRIINSVIKANKMDFIDHKIKLATEKFRHCEKNKLDADFKFEDAKRDWEFWLNKKNKNIKKETNNEN